MSSLVLPEVREIAVQIFADVGVQSCAAPVEVAENVRAAAENCGRVAPDQWAATRYDVPVLEAQHHELRLRLLINLHVCQEVLDDC